VRGTLHARWGLLINLTCGNLSCPSAIIDGQLLRYLYTESIRPQLRSDDSNFEYHLLCDVLEALKWHCDSTAEIAEGTMKMIVIISAILCQHMMALKMLSRAQEPLSGEYILRLDDSGRSLIHYTLYELVAEGTACAAGLTGPEAADYKHDWACFRIWVTTSFGRRPKKQSGRKSKASSDGRTRSHGSSKSKGRCAIL
jgi:hypothetical protein